MRLLTAPIRTLLAAAVFLAALCAAAIAQQDAVATIDSSRQELDRIELRLKDSYLGDEELNDLRARVEPMAVALESAISLLQPKLADADARLAQIGPKPKDGEPAESADVTKERDAQTESRQEVDEAIKRARLLQVEAQQVTGQIAERRRALLTNRLSVASRSLLEPMLWLEVARQLPSDLSRVSALGGEIGGEVSDNLDSRSLGLVGGALALALLLMFPIRRKLQELGARVVLSRAPQSRLGRSALAMVRVFASTVAPALAAFGLYWALRGAGWLPGRLDRLAVAAVWAAGFLGFADGMMRAVLAPANPNWRLVRISDAAIAEIKNQPMWVAVGFVAGRLFHNFNDAVGASGPVVIVTAALFATLNAVTYAIALRRVRAARLVEDAEHGSENRPEGLGAAILTIVRLAAWIAVMTVLGAVVFGYVEFAQFLANQVIWISAVLALAFLILTLVDDLFTKGLSAETKFGRSAAAAIGVKTETLEQFGVVFSGVARLFLVGVAALLILVPWGLGSSDVFGWLRYAVTGVQIGDIRISLSGVLATILLVALGFALTRAAQRWLDRDLLPKTRMDEGLKASVNTAVGYLGGLGVILVAISYLGFSLDRIAIVAGALSVGIGFGLQAVISNFVSGVILLAERPIKAGDWIVIGSDQGNVRRISVRSTEIELFDRSTLIVPNSDFITKSVKNVTHGAPNGRIHIQLSVSAAVDPEDVRRVAIETAKEHSSVLAFPEPQLLFTDLGKADNEFSLFCNVPSPRMAASVKSDLNFALVKAFAAENVALGGPAPPDMTLAVERVAQALGGREGGFRALSAGEHDASDAPPEAAATPAPQSGR